MLINYVPVVIYMVAAIGLVCVIVFLSEMLGKKNLSALSLIFDQDLGSLGGREVATEALTKIIDDTVDVRVKERLGTPQPPRGSGGKTPAAQTDSERLKKRYPTMAADPKWAGLM